MKCFLIFCLSVFLSAFATAQTSLVERLGINGPLTFNETTFLLAETEQPNSNFYIQKYLPKDEKIEAFNQMMTVNLFVSTMSSGMAALLKVSDLEKRMKTDKECNYQINKSADGNEMFVDFLLGERKDGNLIYVEFNVYRYKDLEVEGKKQAVLLYAYSKRSYGSEISLFLETLKKDRKGYVRQMTSCSLPFVTLASH